MPWSLSNEFLTRSWCVLLCCRPVWSTPQLTELSAATRETHWPQVNPGVLIRVRPWFRLTGLLKLFPAELHRNMNEIRHKTSSADSLPLMWFSIYKTKGWYWRLPEIFLAALSSSPRHGSWRFWLFNWREASNCLKESLEQADKRYATFHHHMEKESSEGEEIPERRWARLSVFLFSLVLRSCFPYSVWWVYTWPQMQRLAAVVSLINGFACFHNVRDYSLNRYKHIIELLMVECLSSNRSHDLSTADPSH